MEFALPQEFFIHVSPLIKQIGVIAFNRFTSAGNVSVSSLMFEFKNKEQMYKRHEASSFKFKLLEEKCGSRRIQLRIFDLKKKENLPPVSLSRITLNKTTYDISKYFPKPKLIGKVDNFKIFNCIDLTDILKEGKNNISVASSEPIEEGIIALVDIENIGIKECVDSIVLSCPRSTELQSFDLEAMEEEKEVEEEQQTISLKCPISYTRINIPARGINCTHLTCFDLENYIRNSTTKQCFNCPICYKRLPVSELMIDNKVLKLLQHSTEDVSMISLSANGNITEIHDAVMSDDDLEKQTDLEEEKYLKKQHISIPKPTKPLIAYPFQTATSIPHISKIQLAKPKSPQPKRTFTPNTISQMLSQSNPTSPLLNMNEKRLKEIVKTKSAHIFPNPSSNSPYIAKGGSKDDPIEL